MYLICNYYPSVLFLTILWVFARNSPADGLWHRSQVCQLFSDRPSARSHPKILRVCPQQTNHHHKRWVGHEHKWLRCSQTIHIDAACLPHNHPLRRRRLASNINSPPMGHRHQLKAARLNHRRSLSSPPRPPQLLKNPSPSQTIINTAIHEHPPPQFSSRAVMIRMQIARKSLSLSTRHYRQARSSSPSTRCLLGQIHILIQDNRCRQMPSRATSGPLGGLCRSSSCRKRQSGSSSRLAWHLSSSSVQ